MLRKIPSLDKLITQLRQVPYLASKNVYRVATHFLKMDAQHMERLCAVFKAAQENVVQCTICYAWQEKEGSCVLCTDERRDHTLVCVVESWQDLLAVEKTDGYRGVFHVLGGAIAPLEGVGPSDLTIESLIERIEEKKVKEVILATNQTPEGEATASFIASKLKKTGVIISCLARGVPVGSSLEYVDRVTVYKALSDRRPF